MHTSYETRRGQIETYFDRTAMRAWEQLTSTAPVGRIRATVRAGRDRMRATLLDWLPADLHGARILDAGCGTGAFAMEAARRGAQVLAIDLSPSLVDVATRRVAQHLDVFEAGGRIDFRSGDMTDTALGHFDHVVAMDSLIHYNADDAVRVLQGWAARTPRLGGVHFRAQQPDAEGHARGGSPVPARRPRPRHRAGGRERSAPTPGQRRRPHALGERPHATRGQRLLHLAGLRAAPRAGQRACRHVGLAALRTHAPWA